MSAIEYKINILVDHESLDALTDAVGWGVRGKDRWDKIQERSSFMVTVWDNDKLVGLGRIIEDGVMCMVYDIAVHPDYQGKKIGSTIMKQITSEIERHDFASIGLFAWKENPMNISFYSKFGFEQVDFGMKYSRK